MSTSGVKIRKLADGFRFRFTKGYEEGIVIEVRNLWQDRSHDVIGTLNAYSLVPNFFVICRGIKLILTLLPQRVHAAKYLADIYSGTTETLIPWDKIINHVCDLTLRLYHAGNEIEELWPDAEVEPLEYLLYPILPLGVPTIIFGDGGCGKSLFATLIALIMRAPEQGDCLGLVIPSLEASPVLYLDFEFNKDELVWRWSALNRGIGPSDSPLYYVDCTQPFAELVDSLSKELRSKKIKLLIIDSLLIAAGGNPNDAEPVIRLMTALKCLRGVTTLIIAHTSKERSVGRKRPYGNVFYENLSRSVWECKKTQKEGEDELVTVLYHRKVNRSKKELPIGLKWIFAEDSIFVERCDLQNTKNSGSPTMASKIIDLLNNKGKMKVKDIAIVLRKGTETIRLTLKRMEKKGEVKRFPDKTWGLPEWD